MKLYHGTPQVTESNITLYFTADINQAKEFALGLLDNGEYNPESYIYSTEVDTTDISIEDDFLRFDALAYYQEDLANYKDIIYNPESGWYIVKHPVLTLEEHYKNIL